MQEQPLVSIVLCTFNGFEYLAEQLDSIFSQTYQHLEIVIVDDASTDDTPALLRRYQQQYPAIRLFINKHNIGYNKNFEQACTLATGQYIAISDQDDVWNSRKIELLMNAFDKPVPPLLTHCRSAVFETGKPVRFGGARAKRPFNSSDVRELFLYNQISGHNMLFHRSLLHYALPFPDNFYYDWWLAAVACCNGTVVGLADVLVYQRKHAGNATDVEKKPFRFYQAVQQRLPILLTTPNLSEKDKLFGQTLEKKFSCLAHQESSFPLFWYVLKHARIIFSFKYKAFPYFSYIKHARRITTASFRTP